MKSKLVLLAALLASHAAFASELYQCKALANAEGEILMGAPSYQVRVNGSEVTLIQRSVDTPNPTTVEKRMRKVAQEPDVAIYKAGAVTVTIGYMNGELVQIELGDSSASCREIME